ncbi:MAG: hypothetical protein QOJ80_3071 [Mycobacterium sp.]|jgi:hypothetical protein|nr:hypothetical protein [Mycobacterium sp.]
MPLGILAFYTVRGRARGKRHSSRGGETVVNVLIVSPL